MNFNSPCANELSAFKSDEAIFREDMLEVVECGVTTHLFADLAQVGSPHHTDCDLLVEFTEELVHILSDYLD